MLKRKLIPNRAAVESSVSTPAIRLVDVVVDFVLKSESTDRILGRRSIANQRRVLNDDDAVEIRRG